MDRLILYIDIFLLTFAIGINSHTAVVWYTSPPTAQELERDLIGSC